MQFNIQIIFFLTLILLYKFHRPLEVYIILSGVLSSLFPELLNAFSPNHPIYTVLANNSAMALIFLLTLLLLPRSPRILIFLCHLTVLNSLYIISQGPHITSWGIMLVSTMDACLIAIMYPLILQLSNCYNVYLKWIYRITPVLAVLFTTSSTGLGGIVLGLSVLFLNKKSLKLLLVPAILFLSALLLNPLLLSDSLRFVCWRWSMSWWWHNANHFFGTGIGTYSVLGPIIQIATHNQVSITAEGITANYYTMLHNDWLQCLFELGSIGLGLLICLYTHLLYLSRNRPYLLSSIIVYGATATIAMPSKYVITAIVGTLLVREAEVID